MKILLDERRSSYPSNSLRSHDRANRMTPVLTNEHYSRESELFQTTHSDESNQSVPTS